MRCVYLERDFPNGFEEKIDFSPDRPYTIGIKEFATEDIVPLHYAQTFEMLLCSGLQGEIVIDSRRYSLGGQQLFVIPPYTLHSNVISCGEGTMYVLKVCFEEMDRYINIPNILSSQGLCLEQLRHQCPEYEAVSSLVDMLIARDGDLPECLSGILQIFLLLARHTVAHHVSAYLHAQFKSSSLQELVRWTYENFSRKITIEEAAALTGYHKHHFCSRFKASTGMTYLQYLNSVRISHACLLLKSGVSVQEAGRACGFENTSYFVQLFKKHRNTTPHQYASQ